MKVKKRKKSKRFRGSHTHGRGFKKKARGSGHQGGVGMAGTGKRGDQKKTLILNFEEPYFGKDKALRRGRVKRTESVSLENISRYIDFYIKKGIAKKSNGGYELELKNYKIIGLNTRGLKLTINAKAASEGAIDSVKKLAGRLFLFKMPRTLG